MKSLWIINQYATTPHNGIGGRHYYLGNELTKRGWSVTLIGASYSHIMKQGAEQRLGRQTLGAAFTYLTFRVLRYRSTDSPKRVLNWVIFAVQLLRLLVLSPSAKPSTIIYSSPSLFGFVSAWLLSKRYSARIIFEVRDIWPLSLVLLGGISERHALIRILQWLENFAYSRADYVFSNLERCYEHIGDRIDAKTQFAWIPNGLTLEEIEIDEEEGALSRSTLVPNIDSASLLIGYTGSIGRANALETLLEALTLVRDLDVSVLIVGEGDRKASLVRMVSELRLTNVTFKDKVTKSEVPPILAACDALYLGWRDEYLYRFGIAANKLMEYMYAGRPILHAFSGGNDPVAKYSAGLCSPAENPEALADSIRQLASMGQAERERLGLNGRAAASDNYDYNAISKRMETYLK